VNVLQELRNFRREMFVVISHRRMLPVGRPRSAEFGNSGLGPPGVPAYPVAVDLTCGLLSILQLTMPNIASILKDEITRVARREVRRETASLKKTSAAYRTEIAALKCRASDMERQLRRVNKSPRPPVPAASNDETATQGARFSAKSIASQRRRLGLSAAECGLLVGASAQSIYNWEEGKARPRARHLPAIFALRHFGRREANARLEALRQAD